VLFLVVFFRTSMQVEHRRQQSVIEATFSVADEKVERLDRLIVEQDNVLVEQIDVAYTQLLAKQWPARETPTVSAILVLDLTSPEHEVVGFASRESGPVADDAFRRLFLSKLLPEIEREHPAVEQLQHLHKAVQGQSYLVSYWLRQARGRRYLVVARHDVPRIVHETFPRVLADSTGAARSGVVDEDGRYVFGTPIRAGEYTVGRRFPTTLYGWRLQLALVSSEDLSSQIERRRRLELALVISACAIIVLGTGFILYAVEKERRLSMQKTEFVANVSHELKTPLTLVRMFSELLLLGRATSVEKREEYLRLILLETERLTSLIENVLDFASLEQGRVQYDFAVTDLGEITLKAIEIFRHRAEREGVEVNVDVPPALPLVKVDYRMIQQALFNLLDNALKYAKDGKRIDVRIVPRRTVLELQVIDHGPGVSREEQRKVFDRFVRGRLAREASIRGSGIGLSLVRSILNSHHGYVRVESEIGQGATFTLGIPITDEERTLIV
jgi:two-component system phosphate regulon sensor histidine kinase PhoR